MESDSNSKGDYVALKNLQNVTAGQGQEQLENEQTDNFNEASFPLHHCSQYGKVDKLREILSENAHSIFTIDSKGRTPLHWAACVGNHKLAFRCVKVLLTTEQIEADPVDKARLIDIQDSNGETALHLAAKNESKKITDFLLNAGGDVNIKSAERKEPIELIIEKIPEVMVGLFDKAITAHTGEPSEENLVVALDFASIVGRISESDLKSGRRNFVQLPVESHLLAYALHESDKHCKDILTHPLVQIFLHLKWKKIRVLFYASILSHVKNSLILKIFLICEYHMADFIHYARCGRVLTRFTWFGDLFASQDDNDEITCDLNEVNMVTVYTLLFLTLVIAVKEVFEFHKAQKKIKMYFLRMENMGQWLLITSVLMTSWPVFSLDKTMPEWQYQTAAFGIFLAWSLILSQIGKLPKLGIYVEMLVKVLKSFALFIMTFASLLIAFALSLSILIPGKPAFSSLPLALLKVLIMMIGELNYDDVFHGDEAITPFPVAGHIIFAIFAIMVTIILINLLIGFTVSDIQGLQHDAEISALSGKLEQIYLMESFILSDQMQFYLGCCKRSSSLQKFLVTNPLDSEDLTVRISIKKIPTEMESDVRRLAAANMVQEEVQDAIDEKREKLKNLLKTITSEILAKWEF